MTHVNDELLIIAARNQDIPTAVGAHLAGCPKCASRLAGWRNIRSAAREVAADPVVVPSFDALIAPTLGAGELAPARPVPAVAPALGRSWRISMGVAAWQLRLLPRALAVGTAVGLTAAVLLGLAVPSPAWGVRLFGDLATLIVLFGAVGIAGARCDPRGELWRAVPIGPVAVFWSRLILVLAGNLAAVTIASAALVAGGQPARLAAVIAAWLGPALLSAGVALLGSVWRGPWLGATTGLLLWAFGSVATAPTGRMTVGVGALADRFWATSPPTVAVGLLLLGLAGWLVAATARHDPAPAL